MIREKKPRKKRVYTSMFDEFREQVEKCCDAGMSLRETFEQLPDGYSYPSFYSWLRVNRIRESAWRREVDARNLCEKCEYCKRIKNSKGTYDKSHRLCTKSWQIINNSVVYCPRWCELERGTAK